MSGPIAEMAQEINELRAEIARHHKAFAEISELAHGVRGDHVNCDAYVAIRKIRNIVG